MSKSEKFIDWCDKAMAFSFYALIYFLPISIALAETFTGTAFFFFLLKRGTVLCVRLREKNKAKKGIGFFARNFLSSFKPVSSGLNIPILIVLCFNLISVMQSQFLMQSIEGFVGKVLQSVFLYFNFTEVMRTRKRLKRFLSVFLISCTLITINGYFQMLTGKGFIFGHAFDGRISSSFRHANDLGAYLLIVVPILFCISVLPKRSKNPLKKNVGYRSISFSPIVQFALFLLFLATFITIGLTYSRGVWIGFILSLLLLGIFGIRQRKIIIYFSVLAVAFLLMFYPKIYDQRTLLKDFKTSLAHNNRIVYWERSIQIVKDYPLFGCGLNTYAQVEGRYTAGWGGYPHNSYLQMLAEIGPFGLAAFLWMLIVLFRDSLRALKKIKIQENKLLLFGFQTGLLGFLIHSFFDTNFYSVQLGSLLWIIIGCVVRFSDIENV